MSSAPTAVIPAPQNRLVTALGKAGAIYKRDRRLALSYDMAFIIQWLQIIIQIITFYFIATLIGNSRGKHFGLHETVPYFSYVVVNLAFARFQLTALQAFQTAIRGDQMLGTLEVVMATPTTLPTIVLSTGLWGFTLTFLQVCVALLTGMLLGLHLHVNVLTAIVFVVLTIACMSPLGVMAASTIMTFKQNAPTQFVAGSAASLLGGVLFPVQNLPLWLQKISWWIPITHSLEGIRGGLLEALPLSNPVVAGDALWLIGASAVLMPLSLFIFARSVNLARRDGTLGHY
jgi:ABC-2 type transport system permease protein